MENNVDFNDIKERQRSLIMDLDSKGYVVREYGHEIYPEGVEYNWDGIKKFKIAEVNFD